MTDAAGDVEVGRRPRQPQPERADPRRSRRRPGRPRARPASCCTPAVTIPQSRLHALDEVGEVALGALGLAARATRRRPRAAGRPRRRAAARAAAPRGRRTAASCGSSAKSSGSAPSRAPTTASTRQPPAAAGCASASACRPRRRRSARRSRSAMRACPAATAPGAARPSAGWSTRTRLGDPASPARHRREARRPDQPVAQLAGVPAAHLQHVVAEPHACSGRRRRASRRRAASGHERGCGGCGRSRRPPSAPRAW